jgi:DNA-binding CsgD family transcriptional regulator
MNHVFILIRVIAYTIGIINLVAMTVMYVLYRHRSVLLSIVLMIPFTIVLVGETWIRYLSVNELLLATNAVPALVTYFGVGLLTFVLPVFSHSIAGGGPGRTRIAVFAAYAVATFSIAALATLDVVSRRLEIASFILLGLAITYSAGIGIVMFRRNKRRRHNEVVRVAATVARSMVVFLPLLAIFDFFGPWLPWVRDNVPKGVTILPFFYVFWNSLLLKSAIGSLQSMSGGSAFAPQTAKAQFGLTDREAEVLVQLAQGASYAEIGERLFISLATVKTHVNRIYRKTNTKNRAQLINRFRPIESPAE